MDSNPLEKRSQNECKIDRISDLHDSILGKILSYLPTRHAVATSILSTRWKPLFPCAVPLTRLDLDDSHMIYTPSHVFADFVDKLLNVDLLHVTSVERVVINSENNYGNDKILSWVCAALRLKVKHLRLDSSLNGFEALFSSLNGCTTMVELDLGYCGVLRLPKEFNLPNLKRLLFRSLLLNGDMGSITDLLDGCPVLKDLSILDCRPFRVDTLYIRHPILNKLFIDGSFNVTSCQLVIDAPKLQLFAFQGCFSAYNVSMNAKSLHSVCIDYGYLSGTTKDIWHFSVCLHELVTACSSTTRLRLTGYSVEVWRQGRLFSSYVPPIFPNLTCLALGRMGIDGWKILVHFLISAPNLTILTFEEGLEFTGTFTMPSLPSVPVCLELHVKKIEIWQFEWRQDEIKFIEYFLNNGRVLEELIVYCAPHKNTSDLEKLSMLPRHSKACQVLIKDRSNLGTSCYSRESWFQSGRA